MIDGLIWLNLQIQPSAQGLSAWELHHLCARWLKNYGIWGPQVCSEVYVVMPTKTAYPSSRSPIVITEPQNPS